MNENKVEDLGWGNGWAKTPEIVEKCRELGHDWLETNIGNCLWEARCDICGYKLKYDSSG